MSAMSVMVRSWGRPWLLLALALLLMLAWPGLASAQEPTPDPKSVPAELAPWIEWVREVEPAPGNCRNHDDTVICIWPTSVSLVVDDDGGSFELEVMANDAELLSLVGDDDSWPQDVRVDGKLALVVDGGGVPRVHVDAGAHRIQGRFVWRDLPDQLRLPEEIALVDLVVAGVDITFPSRAEDLLDVPALASESEPDDEPDSEPDSESEPDEPEPDTERVEVSRLIEDGVPLVITTRVDLRIAGQARELILPYPVWADAKLVRIDSELPVALDDDDNLVLQARSGSYSLTLTAHLPRSPTELGPPELAAPWPGEEVWIWKPASDGAASMGQVAVAGASPVDRTRTHAPSEWPEGATYSVREDAPLTFEVLQRGAAESAPNELRLARLAVFDLSGAGWYMLDRISGTMNSASRLDLQAGALGSVIVDGQPQVITVNGEGRPGVELRNPQVELVAQWRQTEDARTIPLAGWSETFVDATVEFKLPRGWDLLYLSGPGRTSSTWLQRWQPLDVILLLGACLMIGLWVDRKAAVAALIGLALVFDANDDGFIPLLLLLAGLAGLQFALRQDRPRGPWATRALRGLWLLGVFLLLVWVLFVLPRDLEQVWRGGAPALGRLELESAGETLRWMGLLAVFATAALASVSVLLDKLGGRVPKLLIPIAGVLGLFMVSLLLVQGGRSMDEAASKQTGNAEAPAPPPPPEEEYDIDADDDMGGMGQRAKSGQYAMKGPSDDAPVAAANDEEDVWGGLTGTEVGEVYGVGGLGLVGTGRGGGGTGEGTIGLGNTGLIGKGGGGGTGEGYGRGSGAGFGGRGKRVPQVRQGKAEVQGDLDRDIIRRIVRAHINEIRACYNAGLIEDPELRGRVALHFVIDGTGVVDSAAVQSSTLADPKVAECMVKAVQRWKFPKPQAGGQVTVDYPFTLENGGGDGDGGGLDATIESPTRYLSSEELPDAPPPEIPQTGLAKPEWDGRVWTVALDRSVEQGEQLELVLLSPLTNKLIALLRALALAAMALLLLRAGWGRVLARRDAPGGPDAADASAKTAGAGAVVALLLLILGAPAISSAAPPKELLDELSDRVNHEREPAPSPACEDECALIPKLAVRLDDGILVLDAEVHMEGPGVYLVPGPLSAWAPSSLSVDGKPAQAIVAYDNHLLVRMDEGLHRVVTRGPIAGDALNLSLVLQPKRVEVEAEGWVVTGVDEKDTATNLEFLRRRGDEPEQPDSPATSEPEAPLSEQARDDSKSARELPVWLAIDREIEIGPRWSMRTTVRRVNDGETPVKIHVPLLEGEQMIESSRKLEDPKATLTLERGGDSITWTSALDTREQIVLTAPSDGAWTERWVFVCGAAWQCAAKGLPPSERSGARSVYHPWPGESLTVSLFKPTPAEGPRLSVDQADLLVQLGEQGSTAVLTATVRTSTVGERTITIPEGARLETVRVDGKEIPASKDSAAVRLTFQPGVHALRIEWKQDEGWSSYYQTPALSLGGEAVNARVRIAFTDDDTAPVLLRTSGTGWGPTVWFWAWLLAIAGLAVVLHLLDRDRQVTKLHDWFLLGVGFPTVLLPMVLGWFLLVGQRKRLVAQSRERWRYNTLQLGIGLLTLITVLAALDAAYLLLTQVVWTMPENFYGDGELLSWYADHTDDAMPQGTVLSVPASLWRVLGVAWVGWFGWRALAWFKWFRAEVGEGGWLRWPPAPITVEASEPHEQLEAGEASKAGEASEASETSEADDLPRVTQLDAPASATDDDDDDDDDDASSP